MSSSKPPSPVLRKGAAASKRERTRERLLDSAAELFQTQGIFAVSLDEVAAHAGVTKGAIYGNFKSKNDLVFSVTVERTSRTVPMFTPDSPLREQLRKLVKTYFARSQNARRHFAFLAELDLYALTHEELATRFISFARDCHEKSAANIVSLMVPKKKSLAPIEFVIAATGALNGLAFQHACYPDIVTEEVASRILNALID